MGKILFYIFIFVTAVYSNGIQSLEDENINYLTQTEKYILVNLKSIKKLKQDNLIFKQKFSKQSNEILELKKELQKNKLVIEKEKLKINTLSSRLDGFETVFSSLDKTSMDILSIKQQFKDFNASILQENITLKAKISTLQNNIDILNKSLKESNQEAKSNYLTMTAIIERIAKELDSLKKENNILKAKIKKHFSDFRNKSKQDIFNLAQNLYNQGKYDKAYEMFNYLLNNQYKPATVSFYIGEIYYYKQGDYKSALKFYKKSIEYYPKSASFTDKLLYHTGYCFEKNHQDNLAIKTYKKLIKDYPSSILVPYAKKRLLKLSKNSK